MRDRKSISKKERETVHGGETSLETVELRKRREAELEAAETKMLRFSLAWMIGMSTSEGLCMSDVLEIQAERPDCDPASVSV